jgi:hypothetical protein
MNANTCLGSWIGNEELILGHLAKTDDGGEVRVQSA